MNQISLFLSKGSRLAFFGITILMLTLIQVSSDLVASDDDVIGLALACVNDFEKLLVIHAVAEYIFCVSCTGLVNSCVIGSVPLCSIFSMKRLPSHTAEMIEGDVANNMSRNSVVSNSVAIEPALVVTASMTPCPEVDDVYVPVDRMVLHAVEHSPGPTREAVETFPCVDLSHRASKPSHRNACRCGLTS